MDNPPPLPGKRSRSWTWPFVALMMVLVPLVLVIAVLLNHQISNHSSARNLERKARAQKDPMTIAELMKQQPAIPDSENAAVALMALWEQQDPAFWAAFRSGATPLPAQKQEEVDPYLPHIGKSHAKLNRTEKLHDDARTAAEAYVEEHADYYRALEQALQRPRSFYPEDLSRHYRLTLPHLTRVKTELNRLRIRATLEIDQERPDKAIETLKVMAAAGQTLKENQLLIDQLVRIACFAMIVEESQRLLAQVPLDEAQVKELEHLFTHMETKGALRTSLVSERAMALSAFNLPADAIRSFVTPAGSEEDPTMAVIGYKAMMTGMKVSGVAGADRRLMLETFDKALKLTEAESPEALREFSALFDETEKKARKFPPKIFTAILLPALEHVSERFATCEARRRAALTAVAVERYRIAHNGLPETLRDIPLETLAAVPTDPFTGKPLLFRRLEKGYVIYSTGKDGVDDHGKERTGGTSTETGYDELFVVER